MKKALSFILMMAFTSALYAQGLKVPAPSPLQTIKQDFGLSNIEISYSRPSVKGRVVFGDLVPYGKIWRTGANSATVISFGDTVSIGGIKVNPGKYGLLTIPGASEWTIIISKSTNVTSAADYKKDDDVVRVNVKAETLASKTETFTIDIANIKNTSCDIQMRWDKTQVSFPVTTDIDARIMKDIERMVIKDNKPYSSAANYYMENGKDLNMALGWYDKAIEMNPKAYWTIHQKANCLAKLGRKQEAIETAKKSMEVAKAEQDDNYVSLNEKLIKSLQ